MASKNIEPANSNHMIPISLSVYMGTNLTPIIVKHVSSLENLEGRSLAVDANNYLYQFLALVRMPDGSLLRDSRGNVTSHLTGLLFRTTRLVCDYRMSLIFVFDGTPPLLKNAEIHRRRAVRRRAEQEWRKARETGDYRRAFSKAIVSSRLTKSMVEDSKRLLRLLGISVIQAPGEAEAQAALIARRKDVWGASSKDYDALLFGTPRLVRFLTITGREFLPSKDSFRMLRPEIISLRELLSKYSITREQLIDLAILVGTDFNSGIKGIGPKTALKLVKAHANLENMPSAVRDDLPSNYESIRKAFLEPNVDEDYRIDFCEFQEENVYQFLCEERDFSPERVRTAVERMKRCQSRNVQRDLDEWMNPT